MCIALPTCTDIHYVQNMHILTALEDFHFNLCTHNSPSCPPVHCTALGDVQVKRRRIWNKTKKFQCIGANTLCELQGGVHFAVVANTPGEHLRVAKILGSVLVLCSFSFSDIELYI